MEILTGRKRYRSGGVDGSVLVLQVETDLVGNVGPIKWRDAMVEDISVQDTRPTLIFDVKDDIKKRTWRWWK